MLLLWFKATFYFVITKNAGSTWKESTHEMKFAHSHGNTYARLTDYPSVISDFLKVSNIVDKNNQA